MNICFATFNSRRKNVTPKQNRCFVVIHHRNFVAHDNRVRRLGLSWHLEDPMTPARTIAMTLACMFLSTVGFLAILYVLEKITSALRIRKAHALRLFCDKERLAAERRAEEEKFIVCRRQWK